MCCESTEAAQLARGRGGGRGASLWLSKSHLSSEDDCIKPPPTDINHVPHTHCRSSVSQYVAVTVTHCSCSYTCSSILFIAPENEDTGVLLECNDSFTI